MTEQHVETAPEKLSYTTLSFNICCFMLVTEMLLCP